MRILHLNTRWLLIGAIVVGVGATAFALRERWLPVISDAVGRIISADGEPSEHDHDDEHDHDHPGHEEAASLELSIQAAKNVQLETTQIAMKPFVKTIAVPAMVVERPGRSQVEITAPLTGVVTKIHPIEGEAISPGEPLFELRLTHEDLVTAQRNYLQSAEELDVVEREIARLEQFSEGVIAGKRILEKQYEQQKIQAAFHAQSQGLLLHGLSESQIDRIVSSRKLLQVLTVVAPPYSSDEHRHELEHLYHVQKIHVKRGQQVEAGAPLGGLADHCELYVEGQAFEEDAERLAKAATEKWQVSAVPVASGKHRGSPVPLTILYLADQVDPDSRAFRFYMQLDNAVVRDDRNENHRFITWKYRPGQRMQVLVPVQRWDNRIVLPVDAVVDDGIESFVFEQNGDHFDRVPVHVEYRDQDWVVIENDGSLIGSTVASTGAYQMHLAIKNKAGGGIDPHAGHTH